MEEKTLIYSKNQKGKATVLYGLHRFNRRHKNKNGTSLWQCVNRDSCAASLCISQDELEVLREGQHTCLPSTSNNKNHLAFQKCKNQVCASYVPIKEIFEDCFENEEIDTDSDYCDIKPTFSMKKRTLQRTRKQYLEVKTTAFEAMEKVVVPQILKENFLLWEDGREEKILVFGTKLGLRILSACASEYMLFGDGTFMVAPSPFKQLFTIHIDYYSTSEETNIVPVIYALLPNKTTNTYERLFTFLRDELKITINTYKCDFERAQHKAMNRVFPECNITGCFFHYNRAVWIKGKDLKLDNTKGGIKLLKMASYLPFLPPNLISTGWTEIINTVEHSEIVQKFEKYFVGQWLSESLLAEISTCNQRHRTNNSLEAWHGRLRKRMRANPSLYLFIHLLRKESKYQDSRIKNSLFEKQKRKKSDVIFDTKYKKVLKQLNENEISITHFLESIVRLRNRYK